MLIRVLAAIEPNDSPGFTVQNRGPKGLCAACRTGGWRRNSSRCPGAMLLGINRGVERLELSDAEAGLLCDPRERVPRAHRPVDGEVADLRMGRPAGDRVLSGATDRRQRHDQHRTDHGQERDRTKEPAQPDTVWSGCRVLQRSVRSCDSVWVVYGNCGASGPGAPALHGESLRRCDRVCSRACVLAAKNFLDALRALRMESHSSGVAVFVVADTILGSKLGLQGRGRDALCGSPRSASATGKAGPSVRPDSSQSRRTGELLA